LFKIVFGMPYDDKFCSYEIIKGGD